MQVLTFFREPFDTISIKSDESKNEIRWITRDNITKISWVSMPFSCVRYSVIRQVPRFRAQDYMSAGELKQYDKFMDFAAQIVEKYGNFLM